MLSTKKDSGEEVREGMCSDRMPGDSKRLSCGELWCRAYEWQDFARICFES